MSSPLITIIIPTYNRPQFLPQAVQSALAQTLEDLEVLVVDDGSSIPVDLPPNPRLRILRLPENKGTAAARNAGARAAKGRYISYLDDDDQLLPHMVEVSLKALQNSDLPQPIAVLSGLEVLDMTGKVVETRLPPTLPRGSHFFLEEVEPGKSFISKQTLVIERELLLGIGGYDEALQSRVHTEMFLRLNPVCSILGVPIVTYQLITHEEPRISHNASLRQVSFHYIVEKHKATFSSHPKMFADFVYQHALMSYFFNQKKAAFSSLLWALTLHPKHTMRVLMESISKRIVSSFGSTNKFAKDY
ncbi:MAG TPA: glycosyltransferase family 2 protein [Nodosilinea sp.]|nr:glycosyltransferase family 2 protein [Nodosilinea sp.]